MACRKFYVYPLLFSLITILASPRLVAAADLKGLVHALEGRLAQLGQGTIHYEYDFDFLTMCTFGEFGSQFLEPLCVMTIPLNSLLNKSPLLSLCLIIDGAPVGGHTVNGWSVQQRTKSIVPRPD